jgi:AsmA protein
MSPRIRTLAAVACALIVAGIVAAPIALWLLLDREAFRDRVSAYVKEQTGLEVTIHGSIGVSLFPAFGVSLSDVSIAQPAAAAGDGFTARFGRVNLKVRLLPLVRGTIDIGGVRANGGTATAGGYQLRDVEVGTGAFGGPETTDLAVDFQLTPAGSQAALPVEFDSRMLFDIPAQRLDFFEASGRAGNMTFRGELHGERVMSAPAFKGRIETNRFSLRELLNGLGVTYAPTGDSALTSASLSSVLVADRQKMVFSDLALTLDESTLKGTLTRTGGALPSWDAVLSVDSLDLDRYMPAAAAASQDESGDPSASLRQLRARGRVQAQKLQAFGLQLAGVTAALEARDGRITVRPIHASLYEGRGEFRAGMDVTGRVPAYHAEGELTGVSVQPLLRDALDITALTGTGELSFGLDAASPDASRLLESTRGRVGLAVREGRIEGADFLALVSQARGIADQVRGREVSVQSDPANRTRFRSASGTAAIDQGVARSDDFRIDAPDLQAVGSGSVDLVRRTVRWTVRASSDQAGDVVVPIVIEGPFGAPSYRVDTAAMLKAAAQQELKRQLERGLKRLFRWP